MSLKRTSSTIAAALPMVALLSAGQAPPGAFTAEQADAGRAVYRAECAKCHGATLRGGVEEPPLAGPAFLEKWRGRSTHDLFNFIQTRMPPQGPGSLGAEVNLQIVAHILRSNGAQDGPEPLSAATAVTIGSLAGEKIGLTSPSTETSPNPPR